MPKGSLNVSLKGADDIFSTEESRQEQQREQVQQIPIGELFPFKNHPFKVLDDESITNPALTVRRITLNANKVTPDEGIYQVDFFTDTKKLEKEKKLQQAMLGIKNKYGKNAVLKASSYEEGATMRQRNAQIGGHSAGGSDGKLQK